MEVLIHPLLVNENLNNTKIILDGGWLANISFAKLENNIVVKVENQVITNFEIKNKNSDNFIFCQTKE